jgi:DNA-binding transcriptional LysR family regulator
LTSGQADLAVGVVAEAATVAGLQMRTLGIQRFVFALAPHHPLVKVPEPLSDEVIRQFRAIAVTDSAQRSGGMSAGLLDGQDVFTVTTMQAKAEAHLRGLGCDFLPIGLATPYIKTGHLVAKQVERAEHQARTSYAWRKVPKGARGHALDCCLLSSNIRILGKHQCARNGDE